MNTRNKPATSDIYRYNRSPKFPMEVIRSGLFCVFLPSFFYGFLKFEFQQIYRFFYCCYFLG